MAPSKKKVRLTIQGADGKMYEVQAEILAVWSPTGAKPVEEQPEPSLDWLEALAEDVPEQER